MSGYENIPKIDALKLDSTERLINMCEYYINEFCMNYKIDDITKISENRFKACLTYIFNHYFKLSLYTDKKRAPRIDSVIDYTSIAQLNALYNSYIYICNVCDKIPSLAGFASYTGITHHTLNVWRAEYENNNIYNSDNRENSIDDIQNSINIYECINDSINNINTNSDTNKQLYIDNSFEFINTINSITDKSIYKKQLVYYRYLIINSIIYNNENALADRLSTSGGGSPVGIIAILNHRYNWNNSAPDIQINAPQISLSDLPALTDAKKD